MIPALAIAIGSLFASAIAESRASPRSMRSESGKPIRVLPGLEISDDDLDFSVQVQLYASAKAPLLELVWMKEGDSGYFRDLQMSPMGDWFPAALSSRDRVVVLQEIEVGSRIQGQGVGRFSLERIEEWARDNGAKAVFLWAENGGRSPVPFYRKNGYRIFSGGQWSAVMYKLL